MRRADTWLLDKPLNCEAVIVLTIFAGIYVQAVVVIELISFDDIFAKSVVLMPSNNNYINISYIQGVCKKYLLTSTLFVYSISMYFFLFIFHINISSNRVKKKTEAMT